MPLIHQFTHTFTHQWRLAARQGTNQLVRSNQGLGVSLRDTSTCPGWDRTGNPPTARSSEPYRPPARHICPPMPVMRKILCDDKYYRIPLGDGRIRIDMCDGKHGNKNVQCEIYSHRVRIVPVSVVCTLGSSLSRNPLRFFMEPAVIGVKCESSQTILPDEKP